MANYIGTEKQVTIEKDKKIHWAGGRIDPPPDNPKCGFDGSKCPKEGKKAFHLNYFTFLYRKFDSVVKRIYMISLIPV